MRHKLLNLLLIIWLLTSCSGLPKREKLFDLEKKGYTISLNSAQINLDEVYLDKNNYTISKNSKNKTIDLKQKNKLSSFGYLSEIKTGQIGRIDNLNLSKYELIIIDGTPINPDHYNKVKLETSSIETLNIVNDSITQTMCKVNGDILVIKTNAR